MAPGAKDDSREKVIATTCNSHCGGACLLRIHVKDERITRIETDDGPEPQLRACLRGRAYRQRVYAPDRVIFPLRRTGERGEGNFERVSWDDALEEVARELRRVRDTCGPEAIFMRSSAGDIVALNHSLPLGKVLSLLGGYSTSWGYHSYEQGVYAELATLGRLDRSSRDDLLNSRLIILWACDPVNSILDTGTTNYLAQARENGTRIISVDPRYTDTAATFAHEWLPIIPGTDCAMMLGMAYVIIAEGLEDKQFLDRCTEGFDRFRDYVLGVTDGVPKTPDWAAKETAVPAEAIARLAREYATTRPAALLAGIAAGRTARGEQYHRVAITLSAMTGNIGLPGGSNGGRSWTTHSGLPQMASGGFMREVTNPVAKGPPDFPNYLPARSRYFLGTGSVNASRVPDAILRGKAGGYPADYKLLVIANANYPNQTPNINKAIKGLKKLEFIVAVEQFLTPAALWADIVLPTCTFLERNDFTESEGGLFFGYQRQAIEPRGECLTQLQIAVKLAEKLGLDEFKDTNEEEILREIVGGSIIPDYAKFREEAIYRLPESHIAFRDEAADPARHPFPTPSGKIEIYSRQLAEMNDPELPPVPEYRETWESRNDPLAAKYPLQLITIHARRRAHSQFETLPWLREIQTQALQINPADALPRGINEGDTVTVSSPRGMTVLPAWVTERIMPGVVAIPQGAWYHPDKDGVDHGGSANVLTRDEPSPGGGFVSNTCLVQVAKG
ncbi:MAG: molybdopterin-dependent oxidoreductase [Chloroflexota bacterium]